MKFTWEQVEEAFIDGRITLEQLIEVLIDNFGVKRTRKIIRTNLRLAIEKEKLSKKQASALS